MDNKIFISIASYRDQLLANTIFEAYNKAQYKDRLVFGVFEQSAINECLDLDQFSFKNQIRYQRVDASETKGVCWARKNVQSMYNNEQYYFQIDAHMLFDQGWDNYLILRLEEIKQYNPKPIITAYPAHFEYDMSKKVQYEFDSVWIISNGPERNHMFKDMGFCPPYGGPYKSPHMAVHGYHLGACFIFCDGTFVRDVPYDESIFFGGEEPALSIRAWTHGYNIFHMGNLHTYHCWDKAYGGVVQRDLPYDQLNEHKRLAAEYLDKLVRNQIANPYGLGTARTAEQYMAYSGLNYLTRTFETNSSMFTVPHYEKLVLV